MRYHCCEERRLKAVKQVGALNGIEYLEVLDSEAPPGLRQRVLLIRLITSPPALAPANVVISGGEREPTVVVQSVTPATGLPAGDPLLDGLEDPATVLFVQTASRGDFSRYTLALVASAGSALAPAGFDPLLSSVVFSFKVECRSDFDCGPVCECEGEPRTAPEIDYLAKDYDGFRRLMLDRLSLLAPDWTERSAADVGVTLVELLAYIGDELSYRQDAVATEAYLATARRRTSLRRHARLVDYLVHEGCNARAWVRVRPDGPGGPAVLLDRSTVLLTQVDGVPAVVAPGGALVRDALAAGAEAFETVDAALVDPDLDVLDFWTWGDSGCCLPRGATSATLVGDHPTLKAGDVLVLAEVVSPTTGKEGDADPAKRAAVRLTHVVPSKDPAGGAFDTPPTNAEVAVTEIAWDVADALGFALCISTTERPGLVVSKAWGNIVLADHGRTVAEDLGAVPAPVLKYAPAQACGPCDHPRPEPVPVRFRPALAQAPLTHTCPQPTSVLAEAPTTPAVDADLALLTFGAALHDWLLARSVRFDAGPAVVRGGDDHWSVSDGTTVALLSHDAGTLTLLGRPSSAAASIGGAPRSARPAIDLEGTLLGASEPWSPRADLLASAGDAAEFVAEVEDDGSATLRFGDGAHGRRPDEGTAFAATYRIGNGRAGNVGAGAIAHIATTTGGIGAVGNPLPASGGTDPEPADAVRRDAPEAFLVQQRAVTAGDYARMTERDPQVQRAAATFRWTGSWHTVFVTADRVGGLAVDAPFETGVRRGLEPLRMAGYDLEVDGPRFVALDLALHVCVEPDYFRAHVKAALLDVLSRRVRADGEPGLFHPDRFTFGQPVYLSAIVAAAQAVAGVASVTATKFQRQREKASSALDSGVLRMGRLEIGRLDNDPSFPEHGTLELTIGGGK